MEGKVRDRDESEGVDSGAALRNLIVSGIRLHAGVALYGLESLQRLSTSGRGKGLPGAAGELGARLDSITEFAVSGLDQTKKDAMDSVSRVAKKAVAKSAEVLSELAALNSAGQDPEG